MAEFNNESSKRARVEHPPSPVLFVRNVPPTATEADLSALCGPFGTVSQVLVVHSKNQAYPKNQAFVEFQEIGSAVACHDYCMNQPPTIHGQTIYFSYSARQSIVKQEENAAPSSVLLVTVTNLTYPVSADILHQIFARFGAVLKIVAFQKPAHGFQALVQMADVSCATQAKTNLDGQNIYSGCNTLKIQFSNMQNLVVRHNNEMSRDFTAPPGGAPVLGQAPSSGMMMPPPVPPSFYPGASASMGAQQSMPGMNPVVLVTGINAERTTADHLFTLFGVYGNVERVKILYNKRDTALIQFQDAHMANAARSYLNGVTLFGSTIQVFVSKKDHVSPPKMGSMEEQSDLTKDYTGSNLHRYRAGGRNITNIYPPQAVLHISSLPESATEEELNQFFSQYAPVLLVKMLATEKKMALVKFADVATATEVLVNSHMADFKGSRIRVSFSKSTL